jgi:sugar O-acyltransferase (sialic acid O-acetyltransferase NeuD family)
VRGPAGEFRAVVYGASGHGKVVADILRATGVLVEGFIDDDPARGPELSDLKVLGDANWLREYSASHPIAVALGIGDNFARCMVAKRCSAAGIRLLIAVHPSATVSPSAKISPGVVVMAQAVINADAAIGSGTIVNTGAIVEHDCRVGDFAHLSPNAAIGGHVHVGDYSWLGIGSSVIPGIKIGTGSIVGAGATVIGDVDDWVVTVGSPARILRKLARSI